MNDLECFKACMEYGKVDHTLFWIWGGWTETVERWKKEGYDPKTNEPSSMCDNRLWFGGWFFPNPPFERRLVEEHEKTVLFINGEGILMREMKNNATSSMLQFIKFPVENRKEFRAFWKEGMQPDLAKRIGPKWRQKLKDWRARPARRISIYDKRMTAALILGDSS